MKEGTLDQEDISKLRDELSSINKRLVAVETALENLKAGTVKETAGKSTDSESIESPLVQDESYDSVEFNIGEYGMAWLGNIVLLFAMVFFIRYLQSKGMQVFSILAGFTVVSVIYYVSYITRSTYSVLSRLFSYNGHLLLFFTALTLHFFHADPLIKSLTAAIIILLAVITGLMVLAWVRKSQILTGITLLMILITGIISKSPVFLSGMAAAVSVAVVFMYFRLGWIKLAFLYVFLVYLAFLIWIFNNPIMGNTMELIQSPGEGIWFVFITALAYSVIALIPIQEGVSEDITISALVINGLGFSLVLAISTLAYFSKNFVSLFALISIFCLSYSVLLRSKSELKISSSMYAIYGFIAMSVAFYGIYQFPKTYLLLSLQSLLVVSMALWFRSRFIVVMNAIMFILLLVFYLKDTTHFNGINFSFMLVAFITARVINWKKERLNIKTEMLRNIYLITGFIMILYAFSNAFPKSFITVSWIGGAILFIIMSLLLKNIKYRWLAIAAVIVSAFRLVFVDMSNFDIGFRVLVFLLLAIISIAVSILYTKFIKRKKTGSPV